MKLIGQGREAEVYLHEGRALRLLRPGFTKEHAEQQCSAMTSARLAGVPTPEVFEVVFVDGRWGLFMDLVQGDDLLTKIGRNPLVLFSAGKAMARLHGAIHGTSGPENLPRLAAWVAVGIAEAPGLSDELKLRLLSILEKLGDGDRLCHGDFHPGNIVASEDGPTVIDWTGATRGDPLADLARSWVLFKFGSPPPGTPLFLRAIIPLGRGSMRAVYMSAYKESASVDEDLLRVWKTLRAAHRLSEQIPEEHPHLVRFVKQTLPQAEALACR